MEKNHIAAMFKSRVGKYGQKVAVRYKKGNEWVGMTWDQMGEQIDAVSKGLLELGVKVEDKIAIFSPNRPEVAIADYGILGIRAITVPIYSTDTSKQAEYIVNDASAKILFIGTRYQYDQVVQFAGSSKVLKKVIVFDEKIDIPKNDTFISWNDFLDTGRKSNLGAKVEKRLEDAQPKDLCTLIYTSGTTGDPKGVMLPHSNFFQQFNAFNLYFPMSENDIALCFLPLSHAYEKCSDYWVQSRGATIYYCEDPKKILDYFGEVRPTYMVGVPRLYEKMYAAIYEKLLDASPAKQKLFNWAIRTGKKYQFKKAEKKFISFFLAIQHGIASRLVLSKIRGILGGRLNFFSAGGAPLSPVIEEFFFSCGIFIAQGYGLTETSPVISCNTPGKFKFGTVGIVIPGCKVKIDNDGEILVQGGNLMKGYYNKPEATAEAITSDGWFKTGDIGIIDPDGFLKITDRKKDIIVTAGGKNISPQNIESMIAKDFYVEQVALIGDKRKYLVALIVPSFVNLQEFAKKNNISYSSPEELVKKPEIVAFYNERIGKINAELAQFEKIKKFTLMPNEFSQANNEITATMKLKRKNIQERYRVVIDAMFEGDGE